MGVVASGSAPLPPGSEQNAVIKTVTDELSDKGFVVAQADKHIGACVLILPGPFARPSLFGPWVGLCSRHNLHQQVGQH